MDIRDFMNLSLLEDVMQVWSTSTGMATIAMDNNGEYLTGEIGFTDFCTKYTRGTKEGLKRCIQCDACNRGVYYCHAGLMDFSIDIVLDNGTCLGKIIGGQILPVKPEIEKFRRLADEIGVDEDEYIEALSKIEIRTEEAIRASAELLGKIVNLLVNSEYIKMDQNNVIKHLDEENKLDPMTRVFNKGVLENLVNQKLGEHRDFGLFMIDLDDFKHINDTYGHMTGDYVLKTFAWKLKGELGCDGIVGRFGGDEFYVIYDGNRDKIKKFGRRICDIAQDVRASGMNDDVNASVGVAIGPEHGSDFDTLFENTDKALYRAKKSGKNRCEIYNG